MSPEVITAAQRGDQESVNCISAWLEERLTEPVFRLMSENLRAFVKPAAIVEYTVSESIRMLPTFAERSPGQAVANFESLARTVATNRIRALARELKKTAQTIGSGASATADPDAPTPIEIAFEKEVLARLQTCMAKLSEDKRNAIRACYMESLTRQKAAAALGIAEGDLHRLLEDARHDMKRCMGASTDTRFGPFSLLRKAKRKPRGEQAGDAPR